MVNILCPQNLCVDVPLLGKEAYTGMQQNLPFPYRFDQRYSAGPACMGKGWIVAGLGRGGQAKVNIPCLSFHQPDGAEWKYNTARHLQFMQHLFRTLLLVNA